ncbi:unnamed protein product [Urochloa decumbens]|uniref:Uncharacterized protein n=1 Tax=Urochloa decumbens TaxID=240449 RepID=A0ABC9FTD4_9POAL
MAASSSWQSGGGELILVAPQGRLITAYDALTGDVVAEFPSANTPRHGLAVVAATGPGGGAALVAASHFCPATGAGSIRLLLWLSPAPERELPIPEPVAALVAAPYSTHFLAGGASGRVHVLALPSSVAAVSFRAHAGTGGVSCLAINDDGSLLVSGGDDGVVAVFALVHILDADRASNADGDLAIYRVAAHVAARLADGAHLRTLALPCAAAALSLALDPTGSTLYAGGSDGRVLVARLNYSPVPGGDYHERRGDGLARQRQRGSGGGGGRGERGKETGVVLGGRRGEGLGPHTRAPPRKRVLGPRRAAVGGALVLRRVPGEVVDRGNGGARFRLRDGVVAWTRVLEMAEAGRMLRAEEAETAKSLEPVEV